MKRLQRLWFLLTSEEVFHVDGTTARVTRVRRAIRSLFSGRESPWSPLVRW